MAWNALMVMAGYYSRLGETKLSRLQQYAELFPDYAGRFAFIGDDGQADLDAAEGMLKMRAGKAPLLAFAAIKACYASEGHAVSSTARQATVRRLRGAHPGVERPLGCAAPRAPHHRFFYFDNYRELAGQLTEAGWLAPAQNAAILRAFARDCVPSPLTLAQAFDLRGLKSALEAKQANSLQEADEAELEAFVQAHHLLPAIEEAHIKLGAPPCQVKALRLHLSSVALGDLAWPNGNKEAAKSDHSHYFPQQTNPRMTLWDASQGPGAASQVFEASGNSELVVPWPCKALMRLGAQPALDIAFGSQVGRCYILCEDARRGPQAAKDGGGDAQITRSASLVAFDSSGPRAPTAIGLVTVRAAWSQTREHREDGHASGAGGG